MRIEIRGAGEHNLKGIDVLIDDGLTVVTGVSGSGKTSLVFDTLYHEARRRLLDVIATSRPGGWRHQLAPARVESITGLGPAGTGMDQVIGQPVRRRILRHNWSDQPIRGQGIGHCFSSGNQRGAI